MEALSKRGMLGGPMRLRRSKMGAYASFLVGISMLVAVYVSIPAGLELWVWLIAVALVHPPRSKGSLFRSRVSRTDGKWWYLNIHYPSYWATLYFTRTTMRIVTSALMYNIAEESYVKTILPLPYYRFTLIGWVTTPEDCKLFLGRAVFILSHVTVSTALLPNKPIFGDALPYVAVFDLIFRTQPGEQGSSAAVEVFGLMMFLYYNIYLGEEYDPSDYENESESEGDSGGKPREPKIKLTAEQRKIVEEEKERRRIAREERKRQRDMLLIPTVIAVVTYVLVFWLLVPSIR